MYIKILLMAVVFFLATPSSADAISACPIAKLYTGSSCSLCTQIATQSKDSIAVLTRAGRLEVIVVDGASDGSTQIEFSDLQILGEKSKQIQRLYQDDALGIVTALDELANQSECNVTVVASAPTVESQLSARVISFPGNSVVLEITSWFFRSVGSGLMSISEFVVQLL